MIKKTEKTVIFIEDIIFDEDDKDMIGDDATKLARRFLFYLPKDFDYNELNYFSYNYLSAFLPQVHEAVSAGFVSLKSSIRPSELYSKVEKYIKDMRDWCYSVAEETIFTFDETKFGKHKIEEVVYNFQTQDTVKVKINGVWFVPDTGF